MTPPADHYFSPQPASESQRRTITGYLRGETWTFITDRGMFSPEHIDHGTRLLIETLEIDPGERVLDVGAGYGPVGLVAARMVGPEGFATLVEVNARAAELCVENAALNGVSNVRVVTSEAFQPEDVGEQDVIVTNPPVKAGKRVIFDLLARADAVLRVGGRLFVVGNKHLGVLSWATFLEERVGPVDTLARGGGFRVLLCTKEANEGDG
jgi:16S rRNA (guanine1207-N2)-methyltransferase